MRGRGELWIRYVPEAKEYMRNKEKDEIGMCQRQRNTCGNRKKMKRYVPEAREYMREREKYRLNEKQ